MRRWPGRLMWGVLLLICVSTVQAVDVRLPDLTGRDRSLSEFRGKWLLVNFWATWCPPCVEEMPELERFHLAHRERDALVVGINMDDLAPERIQAFAEDLFISYPMLLAPIDGYTPLGRITALPTSLLISPEGEVVARHVGSLTAEMIEQLIRQAGEIRAPAPTADNRIRSGQ